MILNFYEDMTILESNFDLRKKMTYIDMNHKKTMLSPFTVQAIANELGYSISASDALLLVMCIVRNYQRDFDLKIAIKECINLVKY